MGNRFREKTVEEGLEGDVAREALKEAVSDKGTRRPTGNRRRYHEPVPEPETRQPMPPVEEEVKAESVEVNRESVEAMKDEVEETPVTMSNSRVSGVAKGVAKVLGGDVLSDKLVLRQIPLLLLCLVYMLLVVANRYQVESLSRKKMAVQERVNELREHQIQLQKMNQNAVRISQIRDDLEREKGLGIMPTPPEVI